MSSGWAEAVAGTREGTSSINMARAEGFSNVAGAKKGKEG
jgi:hypothetical protein